MAAAKTLPGAIKLVILRPLYSYTPELNNIEQAAHLVPWKETALQGCFGPSYRVVGLFIQDILAGFYIVHDIAGEQTLMNIAIHPDYQGQGFGSELLGDLLTRASRWHEGQLILAAPVYLEVRESNINAIRLYERYGFKKLGARANYYPLPNTTDMETGLVYGRAIE